MDDYLEKFLDFHDKLYPEMKEYRLTIKELQLLCRDFQADCYDGFVSNDGSYIEYWLDKNGIDEI